MTDTVMERSVASRGGGRLLSAGALVLLLALGVPAPAAGAEGDGLSLPEEALPMLGDDELPRRARPLIEWGPPLLDAGTLGKGFTLPTGAVWTPALWLFGEYRTGVSWLDGDGREELLEWPNRLDLFFNLQLSGTERVLVGIQPLHREGRFSTYTFRPRDQDGWEWESELEVATLFFEGDFSEIFPRLDPMDRRGLDLGFAVGRQAIEFQDGIMFNDQIDAFGLTRDHMTLPGLSRLRTTFLVGWNDIHRGDGVEDRGATVWGLFNEWDTRRWTFELDGAWVVSDGDEETDGLYWGWAATRRIGLVNTTLRVNGSHALDEASAVVDDGTLIFLDVSVTPHGTHNVRYFNLFWGIDSYTSAARSPTAGGPLGRTGLLFAAPGLGRFTAALGSGVAEAWGGAVGTQFLWHRERTQLVLEVGGRRSTDGRGGDLAAGARIQRKLGRRVLVQLDGFAAEDGEDTVVGLRSELRVRF